MTDQAREVHKCDCCNRTLTVLLKAKKAAYEEAKSIGFLGLQEPGLALAFESEIRTIEEELNEKA